MAEELKKLTGRVQSVEGGKGVEGLNYEDLCIQPDVELSEGYKPPKCKMFDETGDPKVHLRMYCNKLVGVGKNEQIRIKLFMRSLTGDALSWYIRNPKKWVSWVSVASDFIDRFGFNTKNAPGIFYIQNLKNKPTKTFREYATRWRSEAAKFSDNIKLGERIEEGIKNGMVTNFEALQAKNKALQSGGISKKKQVGAMMEGSIGLIREGDIPKTSPVTLTPVVVQSQAPCEVEVSTPFIMIVSPMPSYKSDVVPWDYVAEARRNKKEKMEETCTTQGMTRTGRVYTTENLGRTSKEATSKLLVIETGADDL
uniref:Retrotransposon gag domain-containing protein n=1 Tax=Nicotiana tabacum TaxID=4097 RepID=A0A1S3X9C8_TOBAC|nr:PREDICTED: uncharacterized protein LOC107762681 [Nicotiana tabacum]